MRIKIKTGFNISNILQSTVDYEQAFTELIKNSIQGGATNIEIFLTEEKAIIKDDGIGFDHTPDKKDMTGFDKYFVFGNSYDMNKAGKIKMGHMGIGGKIANDKLSDNKNIDWTIETKNKHGKNFLVEYKRKQSEFLDDYRPKVKELSEDECNIKTQHGTIITINNLDPILHRDGWRLNSIKREIKSFFGELVRNGKQLEISINNESLKFDYELSGYRFEPMQKKFHFKSLNEEKTGEIKFNLCLSNEETHQNELDEIYITSQVKICKLDIYNHKFIKEIVNKNQVPIEIQDQLFEYLPKVKGFVNCEELSTELDHTGMPAKDLSHHMLREDHPVTKSFYESAYETIINLLVAYIKINKPGQNKRHENIAAEVINKIVGKLDIPVNLIKSKKRDSQIPSDIKEKVIASEAENATKHILRAKKKHRVKKALQKKYESIESAKNTINYKIKSFGEGKENVMSSHDGYGGFCTNINSDNAKFKNIEANDERLGDHIAEMILREVIKYENPIIDQVSIDEKISKYYSEK
jgi:hypothetical protein